VVHIFVNLALVVWLTRAFFAAIPREPEEAALTDGASRMSAFVRGALPLAASGLATMAMLSFIFSWNELRFALTLTSFNVRTIPVFISTDFIGYLAVDWGPLSAAGLLSILVPIIFMLSVQRHLVRGLTFGALR
jgi:multiple sugar transport system permease protein